MEVVYSRSAMELLKLPGRERAVVDIAKLAGYCLNTVHRDGGHKARVFASALGITASDASWLRDRLLDAALTEPAVRDFTSEFGDHYVLDFFLESRKGRAMIRSGWIVRHDEDFPRLTTCYVKKARKP
jgi:hypothetical protein